MPTSRLLRKSALVAASLSPLPAAGQSVEIGADIVSRYVWRGFDSGDAASGQPYITYRSGGRWEAGAWGSYSLSPESAGADEANMWLARSFGDSPGSTYALGVTRYYFPAPGAFGFFNDEGNTYELTSNTRDPRRSPSSSSAAFTSSVATARPSRTSRQGFRSW